ncbi:MAG TPA: right-handed parallel beta-helix repeat-containing protein [Polyangiaceae bacterium]|nr:right-handed parallel beta-helix repeat-containing protein [Polyangiaceae bacterium]
MQNRRFLRLASIPAFAFALHAHLAHADTIYVSPTGSGDGTSAASPTTIPTASMNAKAGDTVILAGGVYHDRIMPANKGTSSAWITFKAADGALPIIENTADGTGAGSDDTEYVIFDGIATRHNLKLGFSNKYIDYCGGTSQAGGSQTSNGHFKYLNVIAEGSGVSGIGTFCATDVTIQNAIVAHNGLGESWTSGVNLYGTYGGPSVNTIKNVVSFENIDISKDKSDGSGFIMDVGTKGALFQNNIAFRNGGSCFRITNSNNAQMINNTCWDNAQFDTQYADEIFFSTNGDSSGAIIRNNIIVPHSGKAAVGGTNSGSVAKDSCLILAAGAATPFFTSTANGDFTLTSGATDLINKGATSGAPTTDIGFDPKCIKPGTSSPNDYPICTGTEGVKNSCASKATWFKYKIDYDYIASIGGIKACFQPGMRMGNPDIGAYEQGTVIAHGGASSTGGTSSTGGGNNGGAAGAAGSGGKANTGGGNNGGASSGGTSSSSGGSSSGGSSSGGATANGGGATANGGSSSSNGGSSNASGGAVATSGGASNASGGATGMGGSMAKGGSATAAGSGGGSTDSGCSCTVVGNERASTGAYSLFGVAMALTGLRMRRRRARG